MKSLLLTTSAIELVTGLVLLISPSLPVSILLSLSIDNALGLLLARLAGIALLSLGTVCLLARNDEKSRAVKGLAIAMLLYNIAVSILLAYAALGAHLSGIGLWPVVLIHIAIAWWCVIVLFKIKVSAN